MSTHEDVALICKWALDSGIEGTTAWDEPCAALARIEAREAELVDGMAGLVRVARAAAEARTALGNAKSEATSGATASAAFIDQCVDSAGRALAAALASLEDADTKGGTDE